MTALLRSQAATLYRLLSCTTYHLLHHCVWRGDILISLKTSALLSRF